MAGDLEPRQFWVRSENGKTYGPLTISTLDLFLTNKVIQGKCQVSADGQSFGDPGRFSDAREAFPQELWGSTEPMPGVEPAAPVVTQAGRPIPGLDRGRAPPVMNRVVPAAPGTAARSATGVVPAARPPSVAPPPKPASQPAAPRPPQPVIDATPVADGDGTSGSLGAKSIFRIYYELAAASSGGQLSVTAGDVTYDLALKKGVPHQVRSSAPQDSVLQYMGEKGLLTADAVTKAESSAPQFGNDAVGAAFALGLVTNPGEFVSALTGHSVGLLRKLFELTEGDYTFDPAAPAPPTAQALGNKWALLVQAARTIKGDELRRRLGDKLDAPVMKSGNLVTLEELALNAQEARVAALVDGVRSLAQLGEVLGDADLVARVGYVLGELELVGFADVRLPRPESQKAAPPPEPAPPPKPVRPPTPAATAPRPPPTVAPAAPRPPPTVGPARPPPTVAPAGARQPSAPAGAPRSPTTQQPGVPRPPPVVGAAPKPPPAVIPPKPAAPPAQNTGPLAGVASTQTAALQAAITKIEKLNHFDVLGLKKDANASQVKVAYLQLVKAFHPDTTPADADPQVRPLREKIFARINDANTVLSEESTRKTYLEELESGGDEKVDMARIFQAEELFTKACITAKARKYADAIVMFKQAIQLNDTEAEFHAWLAFSEFMAAPDKKTALGPALQGIEKALKLLPRCSPAAQFAGQMYKLLGDNANATKWLKKALELDPKNVEADRELRYMK